MAGRAPREVPGRKSTGWSVEVLTVHQVWQLPVNLPVGPLVLVSRKLYPSCFHALMGGVKAVVGPLREGGVCSRAAIVWPRAETDTGLAKSVASSEV